MSASQNVYIPLGSRIIIEVEKAKTQTAAGIHLAGQEGRTLQEGTVLKVGPKVEDLKEGDYVFFMPYVGKTLTQVDGRDQFIVVREDECHSKLDRVAQAKLEQDVEAAEKEASARIAAQREALIKRA